MDKQALETKLTEYDSIVLIDRSGSMDGPAKGFSNRWAAAKEMTIAIATLAAKVDDDGITVIQFGGQFVASRDVIDGVTDAAAVDKIFTDHSPAGSTPLADALEAAAKAAGAHANEWAAPGELLADKGGWVQFHGHGLVCIWNPLTDDGDALRLAVKLHLDILTADGTQDVGCLLPEGDYVWQPIVDNDECAAIRRCIVRAAAALAGAGNEGERT